MAGSMTTFLLLAGVALRGARALTELEAYDTQLIQIRGGRSSLLSGGAADKARAVSAANGTAAQSPVSLADAMWDDRGSRSESCCHCNFVIRVRLSGAKMSSDKNQVRFKFASGSYGIAYASLGEEESPGVMKAGTVQNLCFDGQVGDCTTAVSMRTSAQWTQWLDYTFDAAKNYYVSYLHLCGPGGSSSGTTPDGVSFSGYDTQASDNYVRWSTGGATTWYNNLRSNSLAQTLRGPDALVYGHYSRDPGGSIAGGWNSWNEIEGVEEIEAQSGGGLDAQSGGGPSTVTAIGDPHMRNIRGEKFDVRRNGTYSLLTVPRGAHDAVASLRVSGRVEPLGDACDSMFITKLSIAGKWLGEVPEIVLLAGQSGSPGSHEAVGLQVGDAANLTADEFAAALPAQMLDLRLAQKPGGVPLPTAANKHVTMLSAKFTVGSPGVVMRVDWVIEKLGSGSRTAHSLWFSTSNLNAAGVPIGGLLGHDDHEEVGIPEPKCSSRLGRAAEGAGRGVAVASMEEGSAF